MYILTFLKVEHLCKEKVEKSSKSEKKIQFWSSFELFLQLGFTWITMHNTHFYYFWNLWYAFLYYNELSHMSKFDSSCNMGHLYTMSTWHHNRPIFMSNSIFKCYQFEAWQHKLPLYHKSKWLFNKSERLV